MLAQPAATGTARKDAEPDAWDPRREKQLQICVRREMLWGCPVIQTQFHLTVSRTQTPDNTNQCRPTEFDYSNAQWQLRLGAARMRVRNLWDGKPEFPTYPLTLVLTQLKGTFLLPQEILFPHPATSPTILYCISAWFPWECTSALKGLGLSVQILRSPAFRRTQDIRQQMLKLFLGTLYWE